MALAVRPTAQPGPVPSTLPRPTVLAPAARPASPPIAVPAAPARLPTWSELPEAQRRELGGLAVSGAMHADQAALRMVVLNGQVFHEGDRPGPDLQVLQIRLKSVVLSHRGQHFELPF